VSIACDHSQASAALSSTPTHKRKLGSTDFEIADSDDDDYGWQDEDEFQVPVPSQWQGSEDVLLGHQPENDNEEDEEGHVRDHDDDDDGALEPLDGLVDGQG
jgi:hypothetical protein